MQTSKTHDREVTNADELEALLDAHASSSSAYGHWLTRSDPPSRLDYERAKLQVATAQPDASDASLIIARQTLHGVRDIPKVNLESFALSDAASSLLSSAVVERYRVLPVMLWRDTVVLAIIDLPDDEALGVLRFALQRRFVYVRASSVQIDEAINRRYRSAQEADELRTLAELAHEQESHADQDAERIWRDAEHLAKRAPIVNLVDALLRDAVRMRSSDVHIRPGKHEFEVLYRTDGTLVPMRSLRIALLPAVVSRIKILASLDITERRLPQDGRIRLDVGEQPVDLRISVIPVQYGESVVIRILDKSAGLRSIDEIGFKEADKARFLDLIRRSYGIILVTGPTGSGKSTTLYAALQAVKKENVNIITVEDPIEYELAKTRQIQLLPQINFGFPQALRHILRHDPDVIMIGEMRDLETCKIAVESALTGHLVFSTLHTNDASSALVRLLEIGIAPYMIRSAVIGVLAQRLVRKNCPQCRAPEKVDPLLAENLGLLPGEVFLRGTGCEACHFTGFAGRMAIYELMVMNDRIRSRVADGVASDEYRQLAIDGGMVTLPVNGVEQARKGHVSIAEIYRACM
ncbi:MAG: type II/IV secretion system protein [Burkholderiales bacterium]|nr:type II/IV secretion system protein [Burkholderiales bacterium]